LKTAVTFDLRGIDANRFTPLFEHYRSRNPAIVVSNRQLPQCEVSFKAGSDPGYLPEITSDVSGRTFFFLEPSRQVHEVAASIALLFGLGMVCRYSPDIWMDAINDIGVAELTESLLGVIYRKFPNLILDQLTMRKNEFRHK
jgi:hypothetical protein